MNDGSWLRPRRKATDERTKSEQTAEMLRNFASRGDISAGSSFCPPYLFTHTLNIYFKVEYSFLYIFQRVCDINLIAPIKTFDFFSIKFPNIQWNTYSLFHTKLKVICSYKKLCDLYKQRSFNEILNELINILSISMTIE